MAPDQDTLRRRLTSARELRGLDQRELGDLFEQDGLGKHDPARIERGDLEMQRVHKDAFCRHLEMPEWWFTVDEVVLEEQPVTSEALADIVAGLDAIATALLSSRDADRDGTLARWQEHMRRRSEGTDPGSQNQGGE